MNKIIPILSLTVAVILAGFIVTQPIEAQTNVPVLQGETGQVPGWVKTTSGFWANGDISDTEFINAIEFLLKEEIMSVPSTIAPAEATEMTKSLEEIEEKIQKIEAKVEEQTTGHEIAHDLGMIENNIEEIQEQIAQAEVTPIEPPAVPAGEPTTYVVYKKGTPDNNYRLTVECDPGDVATGGGFLPALKLGFELDYHGSTPYPTNYASNPRMNNPTGWSYVSIDSDEARVWVVCLDLTPTALATGVVP